MTQEYKAARQRSPVLGIAAVVGAVLLAGNLLMTVRYTSRLEEVASQVAGLTQRMEALTGLESTIGGVALRVDTLASDHQALAAQVQQLSAAKDQPAAPRKTVAAASAPGMPGVTSAPKVAPTAARRPIGHYTDLNPSRQGVAGSLDDLIIRQVSQHWRRPPSARIGLSVDLLIQMRPDGTITNASVAQSSGDLAFDHSTVRAVRDTRRIPEVSQLGSATFNRMYRQRRLTFVAQ